MRGSWILLTPMLLGGCLPPAIAIASYAADGASYAASGKSLSDHGISAAADKDCATWHLLVGRAVCEDPKHPDPAAPFEERIAGKTTPRTVAAAGVGAAPGTVDLVLGSFSDRRNAARLAQRFARHGARVVEVRLAGQDLARVVIGPLAWAQVATLRGQGVQGFVVASADAAIVAQLARADGKRN